MNQAWLQLLQEEREQDVQLDPPAEDGESPLVLIPKRDIIFSVFWLLHSGHRAREPELRTNNSNSWLHWRHLYS